LEYFMPHLAPSGITGNIAVGKLINNQKVFSNSLKAIRIIENKTGTQAHGIYTVDLKGDADNEPMITEINLRHTAATGSFAQGGCNMAEFQVSATIGKFELIPTNEVIFPKDNILLRDIDGLPVYLEDYSKSKEERLVDLTKI
jgi:hypothetical protein